ncbi:MAG TPA: DUF5668 domain-containing protein [Anaerolineales bacterium]
MYRRSSLFWGSILIILATLLLLRQLQIINDVFGFFWPLLVIALGIWMIVGFYSRHIPVEGQQVSIPLEGAASAYIKLDHGAGRLDLHTGAGSGEILHGRFGNGLDYKSHLDGDRLEVKLRTPRQVWAWWPGESLDWEVYLNPSIPLSLKFDSGASSSILDLSDLKVIDLDIDTGAGKTELILPANAGSTHVDIDTGASSLKVTIPSSVAASIRVKSGIASVAINARFPHLDGGLYQSPDYNTASNRVDMTIDAGVGSIEIE